jgi:hypothetical protein
VENYFADAKIKNDHMIDKMEDRVFNKYDDVLIMWLKNVNDGHVLWDYFSSVDRDVVELRLTIACLNLMDIETEKD